MNKPLRNVPFSPPDMSEAEANEVRDAILSGWNINIKHDELLMFREKEECVMG